MTATGNKRPLYWQRQRPLEPAEQPLLILGTPLAFLETDRFLRSGHDGIIDNASNAVGFQASSIGGPTANVDSYRRPNRISAQAVWLAKKRSTRYLAAWFCNCIVCSIRSNAFCPSKITKSI